MKTTSYCYHSVNVITFGLAQSDHNKRLVLAQFVIENSSVRGSGEINQLLARRDIVIEASFYENDFSNLSTIFFFTKDGDMMMIKRCWTSSTFIIRANNSKIVYSGFELMKLYLRAFF